MTVRVKVIGDSEKNLILRIHGHTPVGRKEILDVQGSVQGFRLDSAIWQIQEKMGLWLHWEGTDFEIPFESRGSMRFDQGLLCPKVADDWTGKLFLTGFRENDPPDLEKSFVILLDFEKLTR